MKNPERLNFFNTDIPANTDNGQEMSKENRLKAMSMSKVSGINEFDRLFNAAVEKQKQAKKEKAEMLERKTVKTSVVKDDMFADLDAELGF